MTLLSVECPNCGRIHANANFRTDPGPVQRTVAELIAGLQIVVDACDHFGDTNCGVDGCACQITVALSLLAIYGDGRVDDVPGGQDTVDQVGRLVLLHPAIDVLGGL